MIVSLVNRLVEFSGCPVLPTVNRNIHTLNLSAAPTPRHALQSNLACIFGPNGCVLRRVADKRCHRLLVDDWALVKSSWWPVRQILDSEEEEERSCMSFEFGFASDTNNEK